MRYPSYILVVIMSTFAMAAYAASGSTIAPIKIQGTTKVDAEGVFKSASEIPDLIIIDARIRMDRLQGYIESSISLPDTETTCESLATVISHLHTPVLFYCNGPKCGRSVKSIGYAKKCGYDNVFWFRGGFEEWKLKGFPYIKD